MYGAFDAPRRNVQSAELPDFPRGDEGGMDCARARGFSWHRTWSPRKTCRTRDGKERTRAPAESESLLEELSKGDELSFIILTDGKRYAPLVPTRDHKRAFDGNQGPNTGGMGAYSTDELLSDALARNHPLGYSSSQPCKGLRLTHPLPGPSFMLA